MIKNIVIMLNDWIPSPNLDHYSPARTKMVKNQSNLRDRYGEDDGVVC